MDEKDIGMNGISKEEVHPVMEDDAAGEARGSDPHPPTPTLSKIDCVRANDDVTNEASAPALGDNAVIDDNSVDTMKNLNSADDVCDGGSLVNSDVANEISEFSQNYTPDERASGSNDKLGWSNADSLCDNRDEGEICTPKSFECSFKIVETTLQEYIEKLEDSEEETIESVDNLNFDEFKANVSKASHDLETICGPDCKNVSEDRSQPEKECMVTHSSPDDIVSLCYKSSVNDPLTENVKDAAEVLTIFENCTNGLMQAVNIEEEDVNDIKCDINGNTMLTSDDEHSENIIHQFAETLTAGSIEKIQPLRNVSQELLVPLKVVEDKVITLSLEERNNSVAQATFHPLECGDNAIANKVEDIIDLHGEEVFPSKDKDNTKHKYSESEKAESEKAAKEDAEELQSSRRTYKARVARLPLGFRRDDLKQYFSQFGEVLKVWDEGRHRANVLFADEDSYKKAICASEPFFEDHKLLIHSLNETIAVVSGIPRNTPAKDVETAIKEILEEAGTPPCRISVPLSDPVEALVLVQGHALIAFDGLQTLQKAKETEKTQPFVIADKVVKLHLSCNEFYEKFCVRVFPLPSDQPRIILYHNMQTTFKPFGEIVAVVCQYVPNAAAYAGYVLFESEDSVKKTKEKREIKLMDELVEIQDFHPFEQGQGFRHLWLKIHNLPPRITITQIKHHFHHDKGILSIELDLDYGSCFMHVNSEPTMQRCLRMHQTFLRGKCIVVMMTDEHPDRAFYREISRRKPYYRSYSGRKKAGNNNSNVNGKIFTSATLPEGKQDQRRIERGDRKFSKSKSHNNPPEELRKVVEGEGEGNKVKITTTPSV